MLLFIDQEVTVQRNRRRSNGIQETRNKFLQCLFKEALHRKLAKKPNPCYFPSFELFKDQPLIQKPCDTRFMNSIISAIQRRILIADNDKNLPCSREQSETQYTVEKSDMTGGKRDKDIQVSLIFKHTHVKVNEEYELFDFGAIVGAVGGSLGLFLGFSALDFVLQLLDWLEKMLRKHLSSRIK